MAPKMIAEPVATDSGSETSPPASRASSTDSLAGLHKSAVQDTANKPRKTLKDKSKVPYSHYVTLLTICGLQFFSGMYTNLPQVASSLKDSVVTSGNTIVETLKYQRDLCQTIVQGEYVEVSEYISAFITAFLFCSICYVLIYSPLRAGMWTGKRASRHKIHRYFGLLHLTQYALAWVEFLTNYEGKGRTTILPHTIALTGIVQAVSAYYSFRVLPESDDAGYFSDKAVMSRNFVHENTFFQLLCVFGSVYYNDVLRTNLLSNTGGKALVYLFCYFPYILIRPFFPITRFKDTGKTGRSKNMERFYEIGTTMIKLFYLWAKYFLGFFLQWMVLLDLTTEENLKFMRGLFLLNVGTVSIAMFLHTLRFRGVLPPRLTFSLYVAQVYATFSAVPYAYDMFASHKKLCALTFSGVLANMTRSRKMHAVWVLCSMALLMYGDIDW